IKRLDYARVNETSADDYVHNSPDKRFSHSTSQLLYISTILLHPSLPATLQNEDVSQLRVVAQSLRDIAGGVATFGAAIDDDLFVRRPVRQKLRQQFVPAVFVQRKRARHMISGKFFDRPRVDRDRAITPGARLIGGTYFLLR